jgi:hypothetical protein
MKRHLDDEQWAAAVLNENDDSVARHLAECAVCQDEVRGFAAVVGAGRTQWRRENEQPEAFWRQQQKLIRDRLAAREIARPWRRWIWVTAAATLISLSSALLSRNRVPPAQPAAQADSDNALLLSVQQSIQSDVPRALRPAALLTVELSRAQAPRRNP